MRGQTVRRVQRDFVLGWSCSTEEAASDSGQPLAVECPRARGLFPEYLRSATLASLGKSHAGSISKPSTFEAPPA